MALSDPIADMLTVLRNAARAKKEIAEVKNSKFTGEILKILKDEHFISNYKLIKDNKQGIVRVYLKYLKNSSSAITGIKRISRPGLRIYKRADELPQVYGGLGVALISTSKGLMTDKDAREKKIGGEVVCTIW